MIFPFLKLPLEIRLQIYRDCLIRPTAFRLPLKWEGRPVRDRCRGSKLDYNVTDLLLVCQQIRTEASPIFYTENWFEFRLYHPTSWTPAPNFPIDQAMWLRRVQIVARSSGISYPRNLDRAFWGPLLKQLTHLSIVPLQPLLSFHGDMQALELGDWIEDVLVAVAENVKRGCYVQLHDDGEEQTKELMDQLLGRRYRTACTREVEKGPFDSLRTKFWVIDLEKEH